MRRVIQDLESSLRRPLPAGSFTHAELHGLPEPVRRYFTAAIAPGAPLAESARLRMRGAIKIGRWLPIRAGQTLTPHVGFVWAARAAGVISGYDYYADGRGGMDWRLAGLVQVAHAEGPDVARASAERGAAEAIWVPTALLPRFGVSWSAADDRHVTASYEIDGRPVSLRLQIDDVGRVESFSFDRWHDLDDAGTWSPVPFGGEITNHRTFGGATIPSAGRVGWHYGTDRWPEGEFFRYEITDVRVA